MCLPYAHILTRPCVNLEHTVYLYHVLYLEHTAYLYHVFTLNTQFIYTMCSPWTYILSIACVHPWTHILSYQVFYPSVLWLARFVLHINTNSTTVDIPTCGYSPNCSVWTLSLPIPCVPHGISPLLWFNPVHGGMVCMAYKYKQHDYGHPHVWHYHNHTVLTWTRQNVAYHNHTVLTWTLPRVAYHHRTVLTCTTPRVAYHNHTVFNVDKPTCGIPQSYCF